MATATATLQNNKNQETANVGDSLFNSWSNSVDLVYTSRKEVEALLLQALETQKETWEKVANDLTKIEDEQKKLIEDLRVSIKENIQKVFGTSASDAYEQWNAQFDDVNNRVQQLTATPYKEGLNLLNQSQEQFQQSVKNGFEQQEKIREDLSVQIKTTQKLFVDLYETNTKVALGLFK